MKVKENSIAANILLSLFALEEATPMIFKSPHSWARTAWCGSYNSYRGTVYRLKKMGLVDITEKNQKKYLQLTRSGKLDALFMKAGIPKSMSWDGKWRIITFDIPEDAKIQRDQLRGLLKKNNYYKFQASVYINPYPLNREAILYLRETGLNRYIRILRVDDIDDDKDLKKRFGL